SGLSPTMLGDHYHLRMASNPDLIAPTIDYVMERACRCGAVQPSRAMKVMLALNEALTNSVYHGNLGISSKLKEESDSAFAEVVAARCADSDVARRHVDIHVSYDGRCIRWVFTDQGEGFDAAAALRRLDEGGQDSLRPSGRGLLM